MTGAIESAILLIVAVICAAILAMAVYPAIFTMAGTFSSASHTADQNIRTDFKIVLATSDAHRCSCLDEKRRDHTDSIGRDHKSKQCCVW